MHASRQTTGLNDTPPAIPRDEPEPQAGSTFSKRIRLKYCKRANNMGAAMQTALAPVLGWLKRYPNHGGRLGRIPEAVFKAKVRQAVTDRNTYRRYKTLWLDDGFMVLSQVRGRLYVDLQHYDNRWAQAHYARKKYHDAARQRACYARKKPAKVHHHDAPAPRKLPQKPGLQALQRTSRSTIKAPPLDLAEQDYLDAQGQTAQPLPVLPKENLKKSQQLPQATSAPTVSAKPVEAANAAVGGFDKFLKGPGKTDFAAMAQAMVAAYPEANNVRLQEHEAWQAQQLVLQAVKAQAQARRQAELDAPLPQTRQMVININKQYGTDLAYHMLRSAGINRDELVKAAFFTNERHLLDPFKSLERAIMNAAIKRKQGLWGPKA